MHFIWVWVHLQLPLLPTDHLIQLRSPNSPETLHPCIPRHLHKALSLRQRSFNIQFEFSFISSSSSTSTIKISEFWVAISTRALSSSEILFPSKLPPSYLSWFLWMKAVGFPEISGSADIVWPWLTSELPKFSFLIFGMIIRETV